MGTNIIKEVSVMRYNEDSSEIVGKEVLKPAYSVDIKVGSSSMMISGLPKSACARSTLTFSLPERVDICE